MVADAGVGVAAGVVLVLMAAFATKRRAQIARRKSTTGFDPTSDPH